MNNQNTFVALTALKEFWKDEKSLLFLGEWCKTNLEQNSKFMNQEVLEFTWDDIAKMEQGFEFCTKIYVEIMPIVQKFLNTYHSTNKSERYWEIIIGNWLITFIQVVYDRVETLNLLIAKYKEFDTIILSRENYITPIEYEDFVFKAIKDEYNMQLYSEILQYKGFNFPEQKYSTIQTKNYSKKVNRVKKYILKLFNVFTYRPTFTLTSPYFAKGLFSYFKLFINSKGKVVFNEFDEKFDFSIVINKDKRELFEGLSSDKDFIKLLFSLFKVNFPLLFLEGYKDFDQFVKKQNFCQTKNYLTSNGVHTNYIYKFWIADNLERVKLFSIQHGGGYCIDSFNSHEFYEKRIVDLFFSWGKQGGDFLTHEKISQKCKPMKSGIILYCTTAYPKYMFRFQNSYNSSAIPLLYIPMIISFFKYIQNIDNILLRGYPHEYDYKIVATIKDNFSNLKIDEHQKSFHERLNESKLFVCDHMQTSYLETLAMNFPTVIYINQSCYSFEDMNQINLLVEANILFFNEKDAALHINNITNNIDHWWNSVKVQTARKIFCLNYAQSSENWAKDWIKKFQEV
jgi:putative transferase (TIGR04331 family)